MSEKEYQFLEEFSLENLELMLQKHQDELSKMVLNSNLIAISEKIEAIKFAIAKKRGKDNGEA